MPVKKAITSTVHVTNADLVVLSGRMASQLQPLCVILNKPVNTYRRDGLLIKYPLVTRSFKRFDYSTP